MLCNLEQLTEQLQEGGIIAFPSETIWSLSVQPKYAHKITELKHRPNDKPFVLLAHSADLFESYISVPQNQLKLLKRYSSPTTLIFPSKNGSTQAVRLTNNPIVEHLCRIIQSPIVSTSVNPSGQSHARCADDVVSYFGELVATLDETHTQDIPSTGQPSRLYDTINNRFIR